MKDLEMSHPALIRLCLTCKRKTCSGYCAKVTDLLKLLRRMERRKHEKVKDKAWEYKGESHTAEEWSRLLGFTANTVQKRLWDGWTIEEAIEVPKGMMRRQWRNESTDNYRESDEGSGEA